MVAPVKGADRFPLIRTHGLPEPTKADKRKGSRAFFHATAVLNASIKAIKIFIMTDVQNLLKDVSTHIGKLDSQTTVFDIIINRTIETMHSKMIGFLINPMAHETGAICLSKFVELLNSKREVPIDAYAITNVNLEYDLGPVIISEHPSGGNIDIYVEDSEGNALIIENKIYAEDRPCQLLRYRNSVEAKGKRPILVYLTLNGKSPSPGSLGMGVVSKDEMIDKKDVICLSYSDIVDWLDNIENTYGYIEEISGGDLHNILRQYRQLIESLIMDRKVIAELLRSGENYAAAIVVADHIETTRIELKRSFMIDIKNRLPEILPDYSVEDHEKNKIVGLILQSKTSGKRFSLLIDWRLYLSTEESHPCLKYGTWDYLGSKDYYNFHDCGEGVKRYLSEETRTREILKVAALLRKTITHIENGN